MGPMLVGAVATAPLRSMKNPTKPAPKRSTTKATATPMRIPATPQPERDAMGAPYPPGGPIP
jgi:hypothetical protein